MPTKWGRIGSLGRKGAKFVEAYLDGGERVELPHDVLRYITETYSPDTSLVFVERRGLLFHFVQWVGTPDEAVAALEQGILSAREVPAGVQMIGESLRQLSKPPSAAVAQESDPVGRVTIAEAGGPVAKFLHDVALFPAPADGEFAALGRDPAVLAFVDGLARIGAIEWAGVIGIDDFHNRDGPNPTAVAFDELVADEGRARAEAMVSASNGLAVCAIGVVLDVVTTSVLSWQPIDARMAKTWLQVGDKLAVGADRVIVAGMTAVALRRWLRPETQDGLYEPFARQILWAHLLTVSAG